MKYGYLNYNFNLYSSYSKSHLLDDNKFEMGGIDSVRGFKESVIKGDKGLYIQNTSILRQKDLSIHLLVLIWVYLGIVIEKIVIIFQV